MIDLAEQTDDQYLDTIRGLLRESRAQLDDPIGKAVVVFPLFPGGPVAVTPVNLQEWDVILLVPQERVPMLAGNRLEALVDEINAEVA